MTQVFFIELFSLILKLTLKINQGTKFGTLKKPSFSLLDVIIFRFTGLIKQNIEMIIISIFCLIIPVKGANYLREAIIQGTGNYISENLAIKSPNEGRVMSLIPLNLGRTLLVI